VEFLVRHLDLFRLGDAVDDERRADVARGGRARALADRGPVNVQRARIRALVREAAHHVLEARLGLLVDEHVRDGELVAGEQQVSGVPASALRASWSWACFSPSAST